MLTRSVLTRAFTCTPLVDASPHRRERARCLAAVGLALCGYLIIFGRLHTLPTMATMLDSSWRSTALFLVGQGIFTTCCRQVSVLYVPQPGCGSAGELAGLLNDGSGCRGGVWPCSSPPCFSHPLLAILTYPATLSHHSFLTG